MADVTFGVKVSEEMKNELSELMKESTVSGKEFMGMLIASYKLERTKDKAELFEGDLRELQGLIKRIQSLFTNMIDKSALELENQQRACEKVLQENEQAQNQLKEVIENQKHEMEVQNQTIKEMNGKEKQLLKQLNTCEEDLKTYKQQVKNQTLLDTKYQAEIDSLHDKIETYKRLELEIQERNDECTKLKQRNDEIASEVWFLKREIEKLAHEKETLSEKYKETLEQLKVQHALEIKNQLLEQKLELSLENSKLKEEIQLLKNDLEKNASKEPKEEKITSKI